MESIKYKKIINQALATVFLIAIFIYSSSLTIVTVHAQAEDDSTSSARSHQQLLNDVDAEFAERENSGSNTGYYQQFNNADEEAAVEAARARIDAASNNTQAQGAIQGTETAGTQQQISEATAGITEGTGECAVGQILANGLKTIFTEAVAGVLEEKTAERIASIPKVPVEAASTNDTIRPLVSKESSALKLFGIPLLPSWDAMGYCLVNAIIDYITYSTIQWINSGFQGNPAFVEDPKQFFRDVADIQAGQFLEEISNGLLCEQFDIEVQLGLLQRQVCQYGDECYMQNKCTLTDVIDNVESFIDGNFNEGGLTGFFNLTQNQNNNIYGATFGAELELDRRIQQRQNTLKLELDWGGGFLSFKDPVTQEITTPGKVIENQLNERLGSAGRRIEMADEFDEIVTALVNQLVKIALDKILTEVRDDSNGSGGSDRSFLDPAGIF